MSLHIASLNSGSNGNCYYVGNDREAVLVDVGISCREVEKRMRKLNLCLSSVKAIFISHEHGDHIRGVEVLAKRYQLPVYITEATLRSWGAPLESHQVLSFTADEPVAIGGLSVTAFTKSHDAADPHSFVISSSHNHMHIGVFTDIGHVCERTIHYFRQCHAVFLETNYDERMLEEGRYPYHLKNRIRGGEGHLSNRQALELFIAHRPSFMSHLLLSHLSQDNNRPELVQELFEQHAEEAVRIVIASRHVETEVYNICGQRTMPLVREAQVVVPVSAVADAVLPAETAAVLPAKIAARRKLVASGRGKVPGSGDLRVVQISLF